MFMEWINVIGPKKTKRSNKYYGKLGSLMWDDRLVPKRARRWGLGCRVQIWEDAEGSGLPRGWAEGGVEPPRAPAG